MGTCAARSPGLAPDHGSRRALANPGSDTIAAAHAYAYYRAYADACDDSYTAAAHAHTDAHSRANVAPNSGPDAAAAHAAPNSCANADRSLSEG